MTREKIALNNNDNYAYNCSDDTYYLDIGRQSHNNYIIHKFEYDLDIAISSYERALEINPSSAEAHYKMATLLWEKGQIDIDSAKEYCNKALELEPNNADARMYLGYFFKAENKFEEAIKQFKAAAKINFFLSAKPRIALGVSIIQKARKTAGSLNDIFAGLGQFSLGFALLFVDKKSMKLLSRSITEEFKDTQFRYKGKFYELLNKKDRAFKVYEKALSISNRKEIYYDLIGNMQKKEQNYFVAAEYYRRAISIDSENLKYYHKLIEVLDDEIDTKEIISCYQKLLESNPEDKKSIYNLGHTYLEDKNFFGAINCFKRAIDLEPENPFYHNSLAYSLVQVNDFDGAINEYQEAINHNTDKMWASIVAQALGSIYYEAKGNREAAIMAYNMSLMFEPDNPEALIAVAEIYYDKGNLDSAVTSYQRALAIDNENPQAHCNLGFVYWEKNDTEKAIGHYSQAITLCPEYDIAYNNLGVAYLDGLSKSAIALKMFEIAIKVNPNYALAYYNKGRALECLRKKSAAADYYQMALDINTLTKELDPDEISQRLNKLFKVE